MNHNSIFCTSSVCTENSVLIDYVIESPNVSGDDRSVLEIEKNTPQRGMVSVPSCELKTCTPATCSTWACGLFSAQTARRDSSARCRGKVLLFAKKALGVSGPTSCQFAPQIVCALRASRDARRIYSTSFNPAHASHFCQLSANCAFAPSRLRVRPSLRMTVGPAWTPLMAQYQRSSGRAPHSS
jgi:hypothetical protein